MLSNRWLILSVLFLARIAMGFQFQSVASVSPFLVDELGVDYASIGLLIGLYMLPGGVMALPSGLLGNRFGDKRVVIGGLVLMALGGIVTGLGDTYAVATVGRLVSGVGFVILSVLMTKMVADWFAGKDIVTAMAIFMTGWPVGIGLALVTQGEVAASYSWTFVFFLTAIVSIVSLILVASIYRAPSSAVTSAESPRTNARLSRGEVGQVTLAGLIWTLYTASFVIVFSFAPAFLMTNGFSVADAGLIVSLNTWVAIASVPLGGYLAQRIGRPNTYMLTCLLLTAIIMALVPLNSANIALFVLMGIFGGAPAGVIIALPTEILRAETRSVGMGIFYTCFYLGMAALPVAAGVIQDATGSATAPLFFGAALLVVAMFVLGFFRASQARAQLRAALSTV